MVTAGVLALQGDVVPHLAAFARLGVAARAVRGAAQLEGLSHLVIPGGESTTLRHLLDLFALTEPLLAAHRSGRLALFGTCAGAILLGRDDGEPPPRLALLDAEVRRNAYGTQKDSFRAPVVLAPALRGTGPPTTPGVHIRAPRFGALGPGVEPLGWKEAQPVLAGAPGILAATFHPELTADARLHAYFLGLAPAPGGGPIAAGAESSCPGVPAGRKCRRMRRVGRTGGGTRLGGGVLDPP